jgi:hypothetical protein
MYWSFVSDRSDGITVTVYFKILVPRGEVS